MTSYRLATLAAVTGACATLSLVAYVAERDLEATRVSEDKAVTWPDVREAQRSRCSHDREEFGAL
jgi:hypothetical protein